MKTVKKIGLFAIAMSVGLSLASCKDRADETVDTTGNLDIDMITETRAETQLSSISVDLKNAKVNYYLGEKFTTEGLVVKANYVGANAGSVAVDNYFLNLDEVEIGVVGSYPVGVTYREGAEIKTTTYTINVKSSYLDEQKVEYLAGLEPVKTVYTVAKGAGFDPKTVELDMVYMNAGVEIKSEKVSSEIMDTVTIDSSAFKKDTKGKYVIKYSYKTSVKLADETNYEYTLNSFVIVVVE